MTDDIPPAVREFFSDAPLGLAAYDVVRHLLPDDVEVRVSTSQVAFRRRRGFAYLWRPGQYVRHPAAEVVLSIALDHELFSPRFKEVVHPAAHVWMHHLEIRSIGDLDAEVTEWLRGAHDGAT